MPYKTTCPLKIDGKRYAADAVISGKIKQHIEHYVTSGRLVEVKAVKRPKKDEDKKD